MGIPSVCFPLIIPGPVISCPPIIRISLPSGRLCRRGLCLNGTPKKAQKALGFSGRNVPQNGRFGTVCPTWGKLYRLVISMRLTRTALKINLYAQRLRRGKLAHGFDSWPDCRYCESGRHHRSSRPSLLFHAKKRSAG